MRLPAVPPVLLLGCAAAVAAWLWVYARGGLGPAGAALGRGVVEGAAGAARGAVDATSDSLGIPSTHDTTTDPRVARWLIDTAGYWEASKWCGAPALVTAMTLPAGSGVPPPPGSKISILLGLSGGDW